MNSRKKNRRPVFVEAVINTERRKKAIRKLRNTNADQTGEMKKKKQINFIEFGRM